MDRASWRILLNKYGQRISLAVGGEKMETCAFFQPIRERKPGQEPTPLGYAGRGLWRYLGPAEPDPAGVDRLSWDGMTFRFIRCRKICLGTQLIGQWGLAEELEEEAGI